MSLKQQAIIFFLLILAVDVGWLVRARSGAPQEKVTGHQPVVKAVAPVFPLIAVTANVSGSVVIDVEINPMGMVTSARISGGHPLFRQGRVYEKVARRWQFAPATDDVGVRTAQITFVFKVMPNQTPAEELTPIFTPPYQIEVRHEQPKAEIEQIPKGQVKRPNRRGKQNSN